MKKIDAKELDYAALNEALRQSAGEVEINRCIGQRFIAAGMSDKKITISGIPGNALGAYLNGASIRVKGNSQDAVGDTMNDGYIIVEGDIGDAAGYAMRGGRIYVKGNAGYRAGIHMKQYKDHIPALVIGGVAGSFLGEYQAGGVILVLGKGADGKQPTGFFCGTGMHGGKIYLRCDEEPDIPIQIKAEPAADADKEDMRPYVEEYCEAFGGNADELLSQKFYVLTPNSNSPYKRMYTFN